MEALDDECPFELLPGVSAGLGEQVDHMLQCPPSPTAGLFKSCEQDDSNSPPSWGSPRCARPIALLDFASGYGELDEHLMNDGFFNASSDVLLEPLSEWPCPGAQLESPSPSKKPWRANDAPLQQTESPHTASPLPAVAWVHTATVVPRPPLRPVQPLRDGLQALSNDSSLSVVSAELLVDSTELVVKKRRVRASDFFRDDNLVKKNKRNGLGSTTWGVFRDHPEMLATLTQKRLYTHMWMTLSDGSRCEGRALIFASDGKPTVTQGGPVIWLTFQVRECLFSPACTNSLHYRIRNHPSGTSSCVKM